MKEYELTVNKKLSEEQNLSRDYKSFIDALQKDIEILKQQISQL